MKAAERGVGEKPENSAYYGTGQIWTLPDAYEITLDVYAPGRADRAGSTDACAPCAMVLKEVAR